MNNGPMTPIELNEALQFAKKREEYREIVLHALKTGVQLPKDLAGRRSRLVLPPTKDELRAMWGGEIPPWERWFEDD